MVDDGLKKIKFYEMVKENLEGVTDVVRDIQRLCYDYKKALDREIQEYERFENKYSHDKGLLYLLCRINPYLVAGELNPWQKLHQRIRDKLAHFLSEYEYTLKTWYTDELQSFSQKSNQLQLDCKNLETVFDVDYIQTPPSASPIDKFDGSIKRLKKEITEKLSWLNQSLKNEKVGELQKRKGVFVAKGFEPYEELVNKYFEGLLTSLKVPFETGERYEDAAIPDKVKKRIDRNDVLIAIVQCRYRSSSGQEGAGPAWLIRELTYADQQKKEIILVSEKGVDLAGYPMEKDIVYFEKTKSNEVTMKFLEALQEHKLV